MTDPRVDNQTKQGRAVRYLRGCGYKVVNDESLRAYDLALAHDSAGGTKRFLVNNQSVILQEREHVGTGWGPWSAISSEDTGQWLYDLADDLRVHRIHKQQALGATDGPRVKCRACGDDMDHSDKLRPNLCLDCSATAGGEAQEQSDAVEGSCPARKGKGEMVTHTSSVPRPCNICRADEAADAAVDQHIDSVPAEVTDARAKLIGFLKGCGWHLSFGDNQYVRHSSPCKQHSYRITDRDVEAQYYEGEDILANGTGWVCLWRMEIVHFVEHAFISPQ